jgi:hypothetical protein
MTSFNLNEQQQVQAAVYLLRRRPLVSILLVIFIAMATFAAVAPRDPIAYRYQISVDGGDGNVEAYFIVNPNTEKREIFANFQAQGNAQDLGFSDGYAIATKSAPYRFAKMNVGEGTVTPLVIFRESDDKNIVSIKGASAEGASSILRSVAIAYFINLLLAFSTVLSIIGGCLAVLVVFNPRKFLHDILA